MFTRDKVILVQEEVRASLEAIAKKHGMTLGAVKANYTSSDVKMAFGFSDKEATGGAEIDPAYIRNLLRNGPRNGVFAKAGTRFTLGGLEYVLHGMRGSHMVAQRVSDKKLYRYDPKLIASTLTTSGLNKPV